MGIVGAPSLLEQGSDTIGDDASLYFATIVAITQDAQARNGVSASTYPQIRVKPGSWPGVCIETLSILTDANQGQRVICRHDCQNGELTENGQG